MKTYINQLNLILGLLIVSAVSIESVGYCDLNDECYYLKKGDGTFLVEATRSGSNFSRNPQTLYCATHTPDGRLVLRSKLTGKYLSARSAAEGSIVREADRPRAWEIFTVQDNGRGGHLLRTHHGTYLGIDHSGDMTQFESAPGADRELFFVDDNFNKPRRDPEKLLPAPLLNGIGGIFDFLTPQDLGQCQGVSQGWQALVHDPKLLERRGVTWTKQGHAFIRIYDPVLGSAYKDPSGLEWGDLVKNPDGSVRLMTHGEARNYCESIGASLPRTSNFENLTLFMGSELGAPKDHWNLYGNPRYDKANYEPQILPSLGDYQYWTAEYNMPGSSHTCQTFDGREGDFMGAFDSDRRPARCIRGGTPIAFPPAR